MLELFCASRPYGVVSRPGRAYFSPGRAYFSPGRPFYIFWSSFLHMFSIGPVYTQFYRYRESEKAK